MKALPISIIGVAELGYLGLGCNGSSYAPELRIKQTSNEIGGGRMIGWLIEDELGVNVQRGTTVLGKVKITIEAIEDSE